MMVVCPGCGEARLLGPTVQVGDVVTCAWCAGGLWRVAQQAGASVLREVPQASCPQCQTLVQLPEAVQPGETVRHCDRVFVVSYAYGAYALELEGQEEIRRRASYEAEDRV